MMPDQRDECGCHRGATGWGGPWWGECTIAGLGEVQHTCAKPCVWPSCLTEAEQQQLADEVMADGELS